MRDAAGKPVIGQWKPILTVPEWEAIVAIVGQAANHAYDLNTRKYLLTSVLRCGRPDCGQPLRPLKVPPKKARHEGDFHYCCRLKKEGGCGSLSIFGPKTDRFITEAVIAKYEREAERRQAQIVPEQWSRSAELDEVRESLQELTAAWRARPQKISNARYFALLPDLEREEHALATEHERRLAGQYSDAGSVPTLRADWDGLTLAEQRTYIKRVLTCVLVRPARRGAPYDAGRLDPIWRKA